MSTLVLIRHGESTWNRENLFTGWHDVDLSERGVAEAREGGRLLAAEGIGFDVVHTSLQRRAIRTAELALAEMGAQWLPVRRHWRLNERHYGRLEGRNKKQTAEEFGADQVFLWRRSYDVPPPPLDLDDERHPRHDPRYARMAPDQLPASECLKDVVDRMLPYWHDAVVPDLLDGRRVLVSAHGNSLRALVKHLKQIPDDEIPGLEIPTGVPWWFELDAGDPCRVANERQLGDPDDVRTRAEEVARQAG
jgi:2,3-bisphosphoglycerate-dependent phosphoglycerate mutase